MRYTSLKDYEKALSGGEPNWKRDKETLSSALNWYNYHCDYKESKKFTLSYLKEINEHKDVIECLEKVPEDQFQNLGFVVRMKLRGAPLSEKNEEWIVNFIEKLKSKSKVEKPVSTDEPTVSIQERVEYKAKEYIGEIEGAIDDCIFVRDFTLFEPYEFMQGLGVKGAHIPHITKFFQRRLDEIGEAIKGKDPDLKEGYSNFSKANLKEYYILLGDIITDSQKLTQYIKTIRKPRKVKAKPVDKVIAKLQYKKEDNGLKIASINPSNIVGANSLWVFNTKTRKLGIYASNDAAGLSVKGTTITNFNATASIQKTVRKPDEVLPKVLSGGKIVLKNLLPGINAVDQPLTGRINDDIIILRAIK